MSLFTKCFHRNFQLYSVLAPYLPQDIRLIAERVWRMKNSAWIHNERSENKSIQFHVDSFTRNSLRILVTARASHSLYSRQSNMLNFLWQLLVSGKLFEWQFFNIKHFFPQLRTDVRLLFVRSFLRSDFLTLFFPSTSRIFRRLKCTPIYHWKPCSNFRLCPRW